LPGAHASAVNGNLIEMGEDFENWRASLPRQSRKEMDRHWRVFTRAEGARFRVVSDPDEALVLLPALEAMQRKRLGEIGEPYRLGGPVTVAMHRELMTRGLAEGFAVLTLLEAAGEIVAAAVGIRRGETMVMIRLCQAGGEWANASPGRLILAQTMRHMHGEGVRQFDLSIGNFAYKRRFQVARRPLADMSLALSWRGVASVARAHAGAWLRRHPEMRRRVRQALGKRALREEA
jgi:CelD/BcsL family acetyltransferase involved in cellulose biosynthesis